MKIAANKNKIVMVSEYFRMGMVEIPFPNEEDWEWVDDNRFNRLNRLNGGGQHFFYWDMHSVDFSDVDQRCTILLSSYANEDIRVIRVNTEGSRVDFRIKQSSEGWEHLNKLMAKVSSLVW